MESDHRHPPYKGGALTTELHAQVYTLFKLPYYTILPIFGKLRIRMCVFALRPRAVQFLAQGREVTLFGYKKKTANLPKKARGVVDSGCNRQLRIDAEVVGVLE